MVAHSSGNHGFAVAYAARLLGISAAIVVPENAPAVKTDAIAAAGAELVRVEPTLAARIAATERDRPGPGLPPEIAPFDDRDVIAGQGTIGLEIAEDFTAEPRPGRRARRRPRPGQRRRPHLGHRGRGQGPAARHEGHRGRAGTGRRRPRLAARGTRVAWTSAQTARTRADALRVEQVGELTFPHIQAYVDDIVTVSEDEMLDAIRRARPAGPAGRRAGRRGRGGGRAVP